MSELEDSCRVVGMYFMHIGQLYERKIISKIMVRRLIGFPGLNIFYEICVPINYARNSNTLSQFYKKELQKILPRYKDGLYL
jgi:hypothetical protein